MRVGVMMNTDQTSLKFNHKTNVLEKSLGASWYPRLKDAFDTSGMQKVYKRLKEDEKKGIQIYPSRKDRLRIFRSLPYEDVRVVILGQDPYHTPGQADGIAFSCAKFVSPSLKVILDRLKIPYDQNKSFRLDDWVKQGIFMLNTSLTVEKGKPKSHEHLGWAPLIIRTIKELSKKEKLVWLLWGRQAKGFISVINNNHLVITDVHPQAVNYNPDLTFDGGFDEAEKYSGVNFRNITQ